MKCIIGYRRRTQLRAFYLSRVDDLNYPVEWTINKDKAIRFNWARDAALYLDSAENERDISEWVIEYVPD